MQIRPIQWVVDYIGALNESLQKISSKPLTKSQCGWFTIVLMGLVVAGTFNWAAFERRSLGECKESGLRWVFRHAKIAWVYLLQASLIHIFSHYEIQKGVLVLDDSDKMRSRNTSKIAGVHKVKDKKTGGYFEGQEFLFLLLVTEKITVPVRFRFYIPNPELKKWKETVKAEKIAGITAKNRTKRPEINPEYPSKQMLGLDLLKTFSENHPDITVQAVLADALYGNQEFMDGAAKVTNCEQVISQLRKNQLVTYRGKNIPLTTYFLALLGLPVILACVVVKQKKLLFLQQDCGLLHKKKRFVIALKYEGETDYRFIVARNLTWRHMDIVRTYTLKKLPVAVLIADWKGHGGWNTSSKQQGVEGAANGVTLSRLCDHLLLLHPSQSVLMKNKQPGMSVGRP